MTDDQIYGLIVQGGIGATALAIIGKIALKVADRMIAAIDALAKEARDTGKATVDALSLFAERLSYIEGKVAAVTATPPPLAPSAQDWDEPSEVRRSRARSPSPEAEGGYGPIRPPRR